MGWLLFCLVAGAGIGFLLRQKKKIIVSAEKIAGWLIYLLIFSLGASVGVNKLVMRSLPDLGGQALILSIGAIAGSALASWGVYFYFFRRPHEK